MWVGCYPSQSVRDRTALLQGICVLLMDVKETSVCVLRLLALGVVCIDVFVG